MNGREENIICKSCGVKKKVATFCVWLPIARRGILNLQKKCQSIHPNGSVLCAYLCISQYHCQVNESCVAIVCPCIARESWQLGGSPRGTIRRNWRGYSSCWWRRRRWRRSFVERWRGCLVRRRSQGWVGGRRSRHMLVRRKDWREEADGQSWYVGVWVCL